jgi:HK97 family phage major capsid protein
MRLSALSVITSELAELSGAEMLVANDHARASGEVLDAAFLNPENASPEATPLSITANARQFESAGSTVALVDSDLRLLITELSAGGSNLTNAVFVMHPRTAAYLGSLRGSGGSPAYPNCGTLGGELIGLPVYTTSALELSGSPSESFITLVDPSRVWFLDNGATFRSSTVVDIEMADDPSGDSATGSGANTVSMFQVQSTAIISTAYLNWRTVDNTSAAVVLTRCNF